MVTRIGEVISDALKAVMVHGPEALGRVRSPIEKSLLQAFMREGFIWDSADGQSATFKSLTNKGCYLTHDARVIVGGLAYHLDFALLWDSTWWKPGVRTETKVAIECDGHAFHERTKEQAARDKSRDRALASDGWIVVRFTGAEIYADAGRCASEALDVLTQAKRRAVHLVEQHVADALSDDADEDAE